jgi:hypothetical protein
MAGFLRLPQQFRQLRDIVRDPSGLVAGEEIGRAIRELHRHSTLARLLKGYREGDQ